MWWHFKVFRKAIVIISRNNSAYWLSQERAFVSIAEFGIVEVLDVNTTKYIATVGITEDFLTSVKLFKKLLPDFIPEFVELPQLE